jgi:hypothetical protein
MSGTMRTPTIAYILMLVLSIAAVAVAFLTLQLAGVWMHDSNFETFESTLSKDEARGIVASARGLASRSVWLLVTINALWMLFAGYLILRLRRNHA